MGLFVMADLNTVRSKSMPQDPTARLADIVIPTHGRARLLQRLLAALAPQLRSAPECGVIIVNDGTHSRDYEEVVGEYGNLVDYVPLERSRGPAHARNAGARRSRAEFVIFTDDDCLPPSHWLDWALARLVNGAEIDVLGGTTIPSPSRANPDAIERFNRALHLYPRPLFSSREMFCLPTANVAVRRTVFLDSGGFDESFRFAAGEDTEFFYRLRMLGARFVIDMRWQTEHPIADSLRGFLRRWYRYGYGNAQHRIRSGDPFENGVPPSLTVSRILRHLPSYVENRRNYVEGRTRPAGEPISGTSWERLFVPLAMAQRFAYQIGGFRAYQKEGYGRTRPGAPGIVRKSPSPSFDLDDRPVPTFGLIIGAMKCGTSALFSALRRHPSIAPSRLKEPRFFIDDAERAKGIHWYLDLFDYDPARHAIALEAATRNTMLPLFTGTAQRMHETGWRFRFVYLVRNPIHRIESHYLHGAVANFELSPLSLEVDSRAVDFSRYHSQLEPFRALFGRQSLLVISHDDWVSQPSQTLDRICRHFGIEPGIVQTAPAEHVSEYNYRRALLIREFKARGSPPRDISADNVLDYMAVLPTDLRSEINAAVDAKYHLSVAQIENVHRQLAEDMRLLAQDYAIDVARWGFA